MKTSALFSLISLLGTLAGCSAPAASFRASASCLSAPRAADDLVVLLEDEPAHPFRVVGELSAKSLDPDQSVELMRAEAARYGLDGLYWVDCSRRVQGHCTAKGFVYTPALARAVATTATH
jgi:hypothetical protein